MFWYPTLHKWQDDLRDGVPFWREADPPEGSYRNMAAPSRKAELLTRVNNFKLKYNGYLEGGPVKLMISRFIVAKVVINEVVKDVRCVGLQKKRAQQNPVVSRFHVGRALRCYKSGGEMAGHSCSGVLGKWFPLHGLHALLKFLHQNPAGGH